MAAEHEARAAKRGGWNDARFADIPADKAGKAYGKYAFITGVSVSTARVKNMYYINFGADYRTDFTVAIAASNARAFKKDGIDILEFYKGKNIRVRGWVKRKGGAMIEVSQPAEIEILK